MALVRLTTFDREKKKIFLILKEQKLSFTDGS